MESRSRAAVLFEDAEHPVTQACGRGSGRHATEYLSSATAARILCRPLEYESPACFATTARRGWGTLDCAESRNIARSACDRMEFAEARGGFGSHVAVEGGGISLAEIDYN